jgi:hypothetical protein
MKKLLFITLLISACGTTELNEPSVKCDVNYLYDNGDYSVFSTDERIMKGNLSEIDRIKLKLKKLKPKKFCLDVYPYQFGPSVNTNNYLLAESGNFDTLDSLNNFWPLGFLTDYPSIERLSIVSICSFTFTINPGNNLKNLQLQSHSCERIFAREKIQFNNLKKLESIHFRRFILTQGNLEGLKKLKKLSSFTANDCEIDLKDLLTLKHQLRYLNLSNSTVLNLGLMKEFKNLEVLYLRNIENVDYSLLEKINFSKELTQLQELSIRNE